jgi:hypothetical protein
MLKNVDDMPPDPHGGSGLHPGSERFVINLYGYDRQKIILLTGPTSLCLVMLWLLTRHELFRATLSRLWLWTFLGSCTIRAPST